MVVPLDKLPIPMQFMSLTSFDCKVRFSFFLPCKLLVTINELEFLGNPMSSQWEKKKEKEREKRGRRL